MFKKDTIAFGCFGSEPDVGPSRSHIRSGESGGKRGATRLSLGLEVTRGHGAQMRRVFGSWEKEVPEFPVFLQVVGRKEKTTWVVEVSSKVKHHFLV